MKFKVNCVIVILASFSITSQGLRFEEYGLASVDEHEVPAAELVRDKRTLTTICVEIKPSSPYEEPYFMCKGTDSPKYSKDSKSDSYSAKPSYKPSKPTKYESDESDSYHAGVKKLNNYHAPSKPEYHEEHTKYDKHTPAYDSEKEYSAPSKPSYDKKPSYNHHGDAYPTYEAPAKPSYADHHDSDDDYAKPHQAHKLSYEKPKTYSHESPSTYDHKQSDGYSKPSSYESHTSKGGYSKPSSSYEPKGYSKPSSYDHSDSHDSKPVYHEESHSKPSYGGNDGHSYSAPKVIHTKVPTYPAKKVSYEHADNAHYGQSKPSYGEHSASKPYSKPTKDYGKPTSYAPKEHHSGYAQHGQNYRTMPQELMQPLWEPQTQQFQYDDFGYRSYGTPMEYQNLETPRVMDHESQLHNGLEDPMRFDLSDTDQEAPTLQSPYSPQTYSPPAPYDHQSASYGPVAPTYASPYHYAPASPSYRDPAYHSVAPSYAPVPPPSYAPVPVSSHSYAPAAPSYAPTSSSHGSSVPSCPQSYMYSLQPVIIPVPCYSFSAGYSSSTYGQPLGAPHQTSSINPLQDHIGVRSEGNSEPSTKFVEDSQESHESNKKPDSEVETTQTEANKSDSLKQTLDVAEEKHQQVVDKNSQDQVVGAEKPNTEPQTTATSPKTPEGPNTKEAFNAMMKMARIAAQLNKDDSNKVPSDPVLGVASGAVQGNEKSSGATLPQFSRS